MASGAYRRSARSSRRWLPRGRRRRQPSWRRQASSSHGVASARPLRPSRLSAGRRSTARGSRSRPNRHGGRLGRRCGGRSRCPASRSRHGRARRERVSRVMPAAAGLPDMQASGRSTPAAASRCSTWGFSHAWMISPGRVRSPARWSSCTVRWVIRPRSARSRIMADQRSRPGGRSPQVMTVPEISSVLTPTRCHSAGVRRPKRQARTSSANRERAQHQGGGRGAVVEAVGVAGDLTGEFGQAGRRAGRRPALSRQHLDGDRQSWRPPCGREPGQHAAAVQPFAPTVPTQSSAARSCSPSSRSRWAQSCCAAGLGGVTLGGPVPQRSAGQFGDDGDQAALGRARPQRRVKVGQAAPGRARLLRPGRAGR